MADAQAALLDALAAGDPAALERLWEAYADRLFGYLHALLASREAAEDALQEVFIRVAERRHRVAEATNLCAYLFSMARNEAVNLRRRHPKEIRGVSESEALLLPARPDPSPAETEEAEEVGRALAALPEEQREVVVLKVYEGWTFQAIAAATGVSLNTVASRYRYAAEKLRANLRRWQYADGRSGA